MKVVIAGGTGFLGRNLARSLCDQGHSVSVLGRSTPNLGDGIRSLRWDARTLGDWAADLRQADALVNLAGRTVDCIKTADHRDEILRSRIESTRVLGRALEGGDSALRVWVQMSTAHIYGDPPELICDEDASLGLGLAPDVARAWEATFDEAKPSNVRGVVLRTSFVLGLGGGAFPRLAKLARIGLGGRIGPGRQGISWIHEDDMNRVIERAIDEEGMQGAYLATAPEPRSNADFMRALRKAVGCPIGLPAPSLGVRLAAPLFMRTDPELALYGRYCVPRRLLEGGFEFRFPELDGALSDVVGKR